MSPLALRVLTLGLCFPFSLRAPWQDRATFSFLSSPVHKPGRSSCPGTQHTHIDTPLHTRTHGTHTQTLAVTAYGYRCPPQHAQNQARLRLHGCPDCALRDMTADTNTDITVWARMTQRHENGCVDTHTCKQAMRARPEVSTHAPCFSPASAAAAPRGPRGVARL